MLRDDFEENIIKQGGCVVKKPEQEKKRLTKEDLFKNFFFTAYETLWSFESWFGLEGARDSFFGAGDSDTFEAVETREAASNRVRQSSAWAALSQLYDYAVDGNAGDEEPTDIVISGAEVLSLITTENYSPRAEWEMIVAKGDGRYALDAGEDVHLEKLALLADVDVRTVRNAISAGELQAFKVENVLHPGIYVDNASARTWLQGRRGFKPTIYSGQSTQAIEDVASPADFAAFLISRREQLGLASEGEKVFPVLPGVDSKGLSAIEAGLFTLPLNAVNPLADFYQLDRKAFLDCVMRVFFADYYAAILESRSV